MKVVVLGAGRVGSAIARDLAQDPDLRVTAADASAEALRRLDEAPGLETLQADLADADRLASVVSEHELVVGALPGHMGFEALRTVIQAERDVADISFFPEDPFELDDLARERGVRILVDCGVAPGLSNLILGRDHAELDSVERFECLVGGLPNTRYWPFEYRAPFSPGDVIEEYVRPARIRRGGEVVVQPALSEVDTVDVPGVGTLESFLTDGLRTLLHTVPVPEMVEKTLRYPGHAEKMRMLRECGFFDSATLPFEEGRVSPLEVTARLLLDQWRFREGEEDLTVMRVTVEGRRDGEPVVRRYDLFDRADPETGTLSMARTTGYTCTACARLLARERWTETGVSAPERIGAEPGLLGFVLEELESRGVTVRQREDHGEGAPPRAS